jgi:hypothetical protein
MTTSTDGVAGRRRVRTSSRSRLFNRLRSAADPEYRGTMIPTRGCPRGEAIARTSRCMVRSRLPSLATLWSCAPRVSRWLRGKPSPGRAGQSGAGVFARDLNGQPLPPFLPAPAESLASPLRGHASAEPVRTSAPLVAGTVGGLTHGNLGDEKTKEGATARAARAAEYGPVKLVFARRYFKAGGGWRAETDRLEFGVGRSRETFDSRPALENARSVLRPSAPHPCFYPRIDFSTRPHVPWAPFGKLR